MGIFRRYIVPALIGAGVSLILVFIQFLLAAFAGRSFVPIVWDGFVWGAVGMYVNCTVARWMQENE